MMNILKIGSRGNDVKTLQQALGLSVVDGVFGKGTDAAVRKYQEGHGLKVDGLVGENTWLMIMASMHEATDSIAKEMGNGVVYNPINVHLTDRKGAKIKYLVIHYTAGRSSQGDSELKTRAVFLTRDASADFVVDDDTMLQVNPDPMKYFCWAVGDAKGKYGIYNKDCISIEICSNLKEGTSAAMPNHEGWYFTEEELQNTLELIILIMKKYNIPFENVIRHYDVSRKSCPGLLGWNLGTVYDPKTAKPTGKKNTEEKWVEFKKRLWDMLQKEKES